MVNFKAVYSVVRCANVQNVGEIEYRPAKKDLYNRLNSAKCAIADESNRISRILSMSISVYVFLFFQSAFRSRIKVPLINLISCHFIKNSIRGKRLSSEKNGRFTSNLKITSIAIASPDSLKKA